jgi:predicted ATPase/DNA-binding SARP family transcriptional activator/Tfp pilus assembly protein PilF
MGAQGVEFRLLGPLEVERDGRVLPVGGRRQRALLTFLLLHANTVVARDRLIDALWGEDPPETAANALQVAVHTLRKLLGADRIVTRGSGYLLRVEAGELDLQRFTGSVERARAKRPADAAKTLRQALALWTGPALSDLGETPFVETERALLEELHLGTLEDRVGADLALGRHAELVPELEALVASHPYRERLRREHMLALYRSGRQAEALEAYRSGRRLLVDELGIEPGAELQELERAILRQDPALALPSMRAKSKLPAPMTPLVGRRLEVAAVTSLLRESEARLLTLTGPGGTGKTRLALEAAWELVHDFRDGAVFVDLASIEDPELVGSQILGALGVDEQPGRPIIDTLKEALRGHQLLLLLDNFEGVIDAAPLVTQLLAAAPELKALVTSRRFLHVSGEHEYPVPPLAVPDLEHDAADSLGRNEAVELFAARTRAVNPWFRLGAENIRIVAAICVALDGLPLAIELAAARTRELAPEEMLERLESRLELLTAGPCDAPVRQRTLRATLDWSFELLDTEEQRLFAALAVFSGGSTLQAAEAVCGADVAGLSSLVHKSLLGRKETSDEEPRYRMLETIREYAQERLRERDEAELLRGRHAEHYREAAERAAAQLRAGQPSSDVYARLDADLDNIRAALRWADQASPELMLELAGLLKLFWRVRGHLDEGRRWLEGALAHEGFEATRGRARALEASGALAQRRGDYAAARQSWQEGLEIWQELGDDAGVGRALGDVASAFDLEGDRERAIPLYEESAELLRRLGLEYELGTVASNLGVCLMSLGRLDEAARLYEEAVELCRSSGRDEQLVISLFNLGRVSMLLRRNGAASERFQEALRAASELGYREMIAYCLKGVGEVGAARGDAEDAARLLGASDRLFLELGAHMEASEQATYEHTVEQLKDMLGEDDYEVAYGEGGALALDDSLALALGSSPGAPARGRPRARPRPRARH